MSVQTQTTNQSGLNFQIGLSETKKVAVCDICGEQSANYEGRLIDGGWFLGTREQFCPECNY